MGDRMGLGGSSSSTVTGPFHIDNDDWDADASVSDALSLVEHGPDALGLEALECWLSTTVSIVDLHMSSMVY